jgi:hypothetical protein
MAKRTGWLPGAREARLSIARNRISIVHAPQDPPGRGIPAARITERISLYDGAQAALRKARSGTGRTPVTLNVPHNSTCGYLSFGKIPPRRVR